MTDIVIMQSIVAAAAVALMGFVAYNGLKLRASERAADRETAARRPGE